jgi:hypothetical protein
MPRTEAGGSEVGVSVAYTDSVIHVAKLPSFIDGEARPDSINTEGPFSAERKRAEESNKCCRIL